MLKTGIDAIGFYSPLYYLDLKTLAHKRDIDVAKFHIGLDQHNMSVIPPCEDIITMATNAALRILPTVDVNEIDLLLFATESSLDQSKSAGMFVHELLGLNQRCRVIELKQACYSSTAALQLAMAMLQQNPKSKILLIASDVAKYGLGSKGESSQGAGAIAMILSANPRILHIENGHGIHAESKMDFWRPNYMEEAIVDGKYSCELYLTLLRSVWDNYLKNTNRTFNEHDFFCYHIPVPKLVVKAHRKLAIINGCTQDKIADGLTKIKTVLQYARNIGNCYTASLYMGLLSLLDNTTDDISNSRIGFYSYGSGCIAEFFSGVVTPGYKDLLDTEHNKNIFATRQELSYEEYENFYKSSSHTAANAIMRKYNSGPCYLDCINNHVRQYKFAN